MKEFLDIDYIGNGLGLQKLDVFIPEGELKGTYLFFHGGGLHAGSRKKPMGFRVTEHGYAVVSVDYRLRPDAKFPDFLWDAAKAIAFVQKNAAEWGLPERYFITGASAGAWITMMLCLSHNYLREAGATENTIVAYISQSSQMFAHFGLLSDRGIDKRLEIIDETAPIYYVHDDMKIKPLLIQYYTDDMRCRPEENRLMYSSITRFVDSPVEIRELAGTHCKPEDKDEYLKMLLDYMDSFA